MVSHSRSIQRHVDLERGQHGRGFVDHNLFDQLGSLDPFINLDDFRMSQPFFPPHPHAGFSVMTYMFEDSEGAFINRDSLGDHSRIEPGGLHWTQAGRGIQHEEIPEQPGQDCHGLQMWVNHANSDRGVAPRSWNLGAADVPEVLPGGGARARVLVGEFLGARAPFEPITPITLLDVHVDPGTALSLPIPADHMALAVVIGGDGAVGPGAAPLSAHSAATFNLDGDGIDLHAGTTGLHVLVGMGQPFNEPFVFGGPFVGVDERDLHEARARFQRGEMGSLEPSTVFAR
jgi:redox-sensitive bicupin YhaK (pirin superfamily)